MLHRRHENPVMRSYPTRRSEQNQPNPNASITEYAISHR